ncbi:MAG: ketoacyl-ACP synthase III [Boseongicola sp. SB0673_bin_14]|nr:ketoacyl-ACP synthase III [Boseongicola sp. SB0673_bin_14]
MRTRAVVQGVGHYLPERVIPNSWFENKLDTSDEWIRARTGIESRHFAAEGETVSELATKAASSALAAAGRAADDVDVVIVATSTPDLTFPSAATIVQAKLGMKRGYAFDVQAVCAGFVFGLSQANALIVSGQARSVLLIGAETFSSILDWSDRTTCVLFGDGAGAVLLEVAECEGSSEDRGILATDLHSDGRHRDILYVDGGVSTQEIGHLRMQGREVFRHAVEKLAGTAQASLDSLKFTGADVDWLVPHQANLRIIKSTAQKLGLEMERVVLTVQEHGNTSAASIPLALSVGVERGQIQPGDLLLTEAIGGGLAWGSVILRW